MITFKPEVFAHHKRQDGTYNIKIRVTFNRKSRHLPTNLYCTQADLTRSLKLKNGDLINKANALCNRMRSACADLNIFDLEDKDVDFVIRHIKDSLKTEDFHLDFFEWADEFLPSKTDTTRKTYYTALASFERFLKKRTIDINDISHSLLIDYVLYLDNCKRLVYSHKKKQWFESESEKKNKVSTSIYLMKLAHIFNAAKQRYNDEDSSRIVIPKSPFEGIKKIFPPSFGQRNLGQELMQKLIDYQTNDICIRIALDAFILSFLLMGANYVDLYNAFPFRGDWIYNRQKTKSRRADHAEMRVTLVPEMSPYIKRLQQCDNPYWLPTLHYLSEDKDKSATKVNKYLKKWCKMMDEEDFTFYAARHTWASLARKAGVEKATIDECLVHVGDFEMTDIYAERDWEIINQANRKVIDLFKW